MRETPGMPSWRNEEMRIGTCRSGEREVALAEVKFLLLYEGT